MVFQALVQCVGGADLPEAVERCLCADVKATVPRLKAWWQRTVLHTAADPHMTDDVYDRLLAR